MAKISAKKFYNLVSLSFLAILLAVTVVTLQKSQNINKKAAGQSCPAVEQCPTLDGKQLWNCHPPEADGSPEISLCASNFKGRVESCNLKQYCCDGVKWAPCAKKSINPIGTPLGTPVRSY